MLFHQKIHYVPDTYLDGNGYRYIIVTPVHVFPPDAELQSVGAYVKEEDAVKRLNYLRKTYPDTTFRMIYVCWNYEEMNESKIEGIEKVEGYWSKHKKD